MNNVIKFPSREKNYALTGPSGSKQGFMTFSAFINDELVGFITVHETLTLSAFDKVGKRYLCDNADIKRFTDLAFAHIKGN